MLLAFLANASLIAGYRACREPRAWRIAIASYLLALALLAKVTPALLIVLVPLAAWAVAQRRARVLVDGRVWIAVVAALGGGLWWYAYVWFAAPEEGPEQAGSQPEPLPGAWGARSAPVLGAEGAVEVQARRGGAGGVSSVRKSGGREMADGPDSNADLSTQRLPGRSEVPMPTEAADGIAQHLLGLSAPSAPQTTDTTGSHASASPVGERASQSPAGLGRYRVMEELGRGGMGVVYRARDNTLGRDVALKVLQVAGGEDAETIERFQREARAAAALDHPNIVRVYDVGVLPGADGQEGHPYYTMELLAGQDLGQAIHGGQIAPKDAVEVVRQVSLALHYAHQKGSPRIRVDLSQVASQV